MTNKITEIPFRGTPEQEAKLKEVIAAHKGHSDAMMPVLQKAQEIYGYLPIEVQTMVAEGLGVSLEQVYGVSTFYSWFTLEPKGEHLIRVCLGTACYVKGSADILAELERQLGVKAGHTTPDGKFTLEATRCLGCCGLAPVMTIDDDVFGRLVPADVKGIVDKFRA
jgi:NADH:ubiquinone oxidoreductase subunit E